MSQKIFVNELMDGWMDPCINQFPIVCAIEMRGGLKVYETKKNKKIKYMR